jgi:Mu transposase, C-terminal domain
VVRIREILSDKYGHDIPYSTLTRLVQKMGLRDGKKKQRAGSYNFGPGEELQHDTSPHRITLGGKKITAQCAGLVLAYSRKVFIQYYPSFTRFEAKVFLSKALEYMGGSCPRCIIDNTSVMVAHGSGPDAQIAPEMEAFGKTFGMSFVPHRIGHADRKARVERNFSYAENNFLAGRTFTDWHDLNQRGQKWCDIVANKKLKRSLGMSPDEAYLIEKPHLLPLPAYIPVACKTLQRIVDMSGYVIVDTNRYSVPEHFCGKKVEVHKTWDRILVFFKQKKIADHKRAIDKRDTKVMAKGHHLPLNKYKGQKGPCKEENALVGQCDVTDQYVDGVKKRSHGTGKRKLQRLLDLKRTYPADAFEKAIEQALHYGLYDLARLENMILSYVAGDFFNIKKED